MALPRPQFTCRNTARCAPDAWKSGCSTTIPAAMTGYTPPCSGRARISNSSRRRSARPQPIEREEVRVDSSITNNRDQAVEGEAGQPHHFRFVACRAPAAEGQAQPFCRSHESPLTQNGDRMLPRTALTLLRWWNVQPYQMRNMVTFVAGIALPRMRSTCKYSARAQMATQRPIAACADKVL